MASARDILMAAIDRWSEAGLLEPSLEAELRQDVTSSTARERARWSQFIVAGTGAVVSLIAAGVFLGWAWPVMDVAARTMVLIAVGLALDLLGIRLERRDRWTPASYLMQTAGLGILLGAGAYSVDAWPNATAGGVLIGLVVLLVPLVGGWHSVRRNPVMPAIHVAAGYAFFGLFLNRAFDLSGDEIVWILDAVLLLSVMVLLRRIRLRGTEGDSEWALNAFVASLYAGLVLVFFTAIGPLNMTDDAVFALDLWWVTVVGLTLWGIHGAPPALQRSWYETQLGWSVGLGTIFVFATANAFDFSNCSMARAPLRWVR